VTAERLRIRPLAPFRLSYVEPIDVPTSTSRVLAWPVVESERSSIIHGLSSDWVVLSRDGDGLHASGAFMTAADFEVFEELAERNGLHLDVGDRAVHSPRRRNLPSDCFTELLSP
jgi:hypothetical protein